MKLLLILLSFSFSINTFAQDVKLKLASDVWPPFTNTPENKAFALDLVKEGLHRTGVELENEIVDVADLMGDIKEGVYHGSSALWKSEERDDFMLFSDPYLQNQLVLVGLKGTNVGIGKLSDLINKRVAIVKSYAYGPEIEKASKVIFVKGQSDQENLDKLFDGQVDYILVDDLLIQYLVTYQQKDVAKYLAIGNTPLFTRSLHFAIRKDVPNANHIINQFNAEILKMVADGTYNRILQLNWISADVDGDGQLELIPNEDHAGITAPLSSYSVYFKNSNSTIASTSNRYFVHGQIYNGWEEIPGEYKVAPKKVGSADDVTFLKFKF